jgi:hypothetical protein
MGLQGMRVPRCGQALEEAGAQIADAELKLLGHLLVTSAPESQGVLALAANQVMCPSCFANLLRFRALRPGIDIFTSLPNQWFAGAGAAGAGAAAESAAD